MNMRRFGLRRFLKMNKQEYLIITFHSLDDAMDLDANQIHYEKIVKVVF